LKETEQAFRPAMPVPEILLCPAPTYAEILAEIERLELILQKLKHDAGLALK
jgi:hypothetical protein